MSRPFGLSVLMPCYNGNCTAQLLELRGQIDALRLEGVDAEVVVLEDGSTDAAAIAANERACAYPAFRHLVEQTNEGLAAARNKLLQAASYEWMLLLDSDLYPGGNDFLATYVAATRSCIERGVVYGGLRNLKPSFPCLRYDYETGTAHRRTPQMRRKHPYAAVAAANLLIHESVALEVCFDSRIRTYGYEDVMFARQLRLRHIPILHIDNPAEIRHFDDNATYMRKTDLALATLYRFRAELHDDVGMLVRLDRLRRYVPSWVLRMLSAACLPLLRANLSGRHPLWHLYNPYKLLRYVALEAKKDAPNKNLLT